MSVVKSSVINLYDSLSGDNHFQAKVSSDRVDVQISSLPLNLKGATVNLTNEGGNTILDVVETIRSTQQSVVDEAAARVSAVAAEAALRVSGDADLQTAVNQEASDRSAAMTAETAIRVAAESALDVKITEEKGARVAAVSAEISARSGADTVLQTNIDSEATTRIAGDTTLQSNLDSESAARTAAVLAELNARSAADATLQSNIVAEAVSRVSGDAAVQAAVDQEVSDRQADVSAEESARIAADASLQSAIDSEAATRLSSDQTLQANISSETSARISAISSEATARSNADNTLSASILAEQVARIAEVAAERARIDAILDGTDVDLNQLKELIVAYTTSDDNILSQISQINTTVAGIQSQLDGTDAALNTLIANIEATQAPALTEIFTTANGLTDMSLVTQSGGNPSYMGYDIFNGIYGADVEYYGWASQAPQPLTINGTSENGHYVYVDLSTVAPTDPVKSFELWAHGEKYTPRDFYIVGSNDGVNFTKLYDNNGVNVFTNETAPGSAPDMNGNITGVTRLYTDRIDMSNSTVYSHIGIFATSAFFDGNFDAPNPTASVWIQELRLFK